NNFGMHRQPRRTRPSLGRLARKHIDSRARNPALVQCPDKRVLIIHAAPRNIQHPRRPLHGPQLPVPEQIQRTGQQRRMDRQEIQPRQHLAQTLHHPHAILTRHINTHVRIHTHNLHPQPLARHPRNFHPDFAQADYAKRLAADFHTDQLAPLPLARLDTRVATAYIPRRGEQQRNRVLSSSSNVARGGIDDNDPLRRGSVNVDIVHAHARARHDTQLVRCLEDLRRDFGLRPDDERVVGWDEAEEVVGAGGPGRVVDLEAG
ncbi:hypothetical protein BD289DRAFT_444969, partial [Coniella lustricola]